MQFTVFTAAALLPLVAHAIDNEQGAIFAGGPQDPPASTSAALTEVPTVGTVVTEGGSSYVAPIETYPAGTAPTETMPSVYPIGTAPTETMPSVYPIGTAPIETMPSVLPPVGTAPAETIPAPATTPLVHPINGTYIGGPPPTGNLSTTLGSSTTKAGGSGGSGSGSGSTVVLTTTGSGGELVTQTSVVAVAPTDAEGGGDEATPSGEAGEGSTQPGAGTKIQAGAAAALAALAGVGAFFL